MTRIEELRPCIHMITGGRKCAWGEEDSCNAFWKAPGQWAQALNEACDIAEELAKKHKLLVESINEDDVDCLPECDQYGHAENCPYTNFAIRQQQLIKQHIDDAVLHLADEQTIRNLEKKYDRMFQFAQHLIDVHCADCTCKEWEKP